MRRRVLLLAFASAILAGTPSRADERNVSVVNQTGYAINFLGFNVAGDNEWNDNELSSVLNDGASVYVKFSGSDKGCSWNIRVDWANYDSGVLWRGVDLCTINTLTLKYDKDSRVTSFTAE